MPTIYLKVAGFTIKLIFEHEDDIFYKNKCIHDIKKYFKGFIIKGTFQVDYSLRFIQTRSYPIEKKDQLGKKYINYFIDIGKKEGITFYITSIPQLELILVDIVSKLFKQTVGFFFHASASLVKNTAYLFTGDSGAGKSTIAELLSLEYEPISEDIAIMKKTDTSYYMYQTTHHEKKDNIRKNAVGYKIGKVFFLKKSKINEIKKITDKDEIMKRISSQIILYFMRDTSSIKHLLKFVSTFNSFYELSFSKNRKEVIRLIKELE